MLFSVFVVVLAAAALVQASNMPTQVHIALAGVDSDGHSNAMTVSWNTETDTKTTTVKYGTESGVYTTSSTGKSGKYYRTYNHHVVLNVLKPSTKYFYIVGDETDGWSAEHEFTSAPLTSALRGNFSFAVFGDLGLFNGDPSNNYIKSIQNEVDLVWHAGDVGYADDSFLHPDCVVKFCYEDAFDTYMKGVESWASHLPYMVMPGNHEAGT